MQNKKDIGNGKPDNMNQPRDTRLQRCGCGGNEGASGNMSDHALSSINSATRATPTVILRHLSLVRWSVDMRELPQTVAAHSFSTTPFVNLSQSAAMYSKIGVPEPPTYSARL